LADLAWDSKIRVKGRSATGWGRLLIERKERIKAEQEEVFNIYKP